MDEIAKNNREQYNIHAEDWKEEIGTNVPHLYLEKPAMQASLPKNLSGKRVLCVGVGLGDEIRDIKRRNPKKIVGIDISKKLLEFARKEHPDVFFKELDMMKVAGIFPEESFDLVYSSQVLLFIMRRIGTSYCLKCIRF